MNTTSTPKSLADLKHQEHVKEVTPQQTVDEVAEYFFRNLFSDDIRPVKVNFLFEEDETKVYEAYKDSGSDDYLYIIKK